MEDPRTRTPLEKDIAEAVKRAHEGRAAGMIGWSEAKQIAEYLKDRGYVIELRNRPK